MEKSRRLNKEYCIDTSFPLNVKIGTVNRERPTVIYINGKTWLEGNADTQNGKSLIKTVIRSGIRKLMCEHDLFEQQYILDFDFNSDTDNSRRRFCSFEFFLKQKGETVEDLKTLQSRLARSIAVMVEDISESFHESGYRLYKKKTGN